MKASFVAAALGLLSFASAAPARRNNGGGKPDIDAVILNYALTLEHLEDNFYREGLTKYSDSDFTDAGLDSSVRQRITEIGKHESAHVAFLTAGLTAAGATPVKACQYDFGLTDVKSFLATASILEGVGVSAYLGAAALITNGDYLTAAGTILTVESRHSSYIRNTNGQDPFPQAFDTPLSINEVYSLAAPFITSCPSDNPALPVKAFPGLTIKADGGSAPGGMVTIKVADPKTLEGIDEPLYAAWIGFPANAYGAYNPETGSIMIPADGGFNGQVYVVLIKGDPKNGVTDDNTVAGPAIFEIMNTE